MISHLNGTIIKKTPSFIIIDINGVGYMVNILPKILDKVSENEKVKLFTHQYVREDAIALYGFNNFEELQTFEILISISGIGPKLAFNILSATSPQKLRKAVAKTDVTILSRIPGIGKKTASKIMLELASKLGVEQNLAKIFFSKEDEMAVEALINLGFKTNEAREAIQREGKRFTTLEEKIKAGLNFLGKSKS